MKKIITRLVLVACLLGVTAFIAVPAAADSTVSIGLESSQVYEGDTFTLEVRIEGVENFDAAQYDISYDPSVLAVTGVTDGLIGSTSIPVSGWAYIPGATQGKIRVINNIDGIVEGVTGDGYLAVIGFQVIGDAGTSSDITISDGLLGNTSAQAIPTTWPSSPDTVSILSHVVAGFSANTTEAMVGDTIEFTAEISGGTGPYTYSWDFDNDGTEDSTDVNPTYSYATAGLKTVSFTVNDAGDGSDTETKTDYINVYADLDAVVTANMTRSVAGQLILFGTEGTTGGKETYTYSWDFGDSAGTSTEADPEYSFAATGNYTVTLTVIDALGNVDTDQIEIQVREAGDANGDESIGITDITYLEHVMMEDDGYIPSSWCDMNLDGSWDATDMTAIQNIILESTPD